MDSKAIASYIFGTYSRVSNNNSIAYPKALITQFENYVLHENKTSYNWCISKFLPLKYIVFIPINLKPR